MVKEDNIDKQLTALKNADLYEISLCNKPVNLEEGFLIKKSNSNNKGEQIMADEETEQEKEVKEDEGSFDINSLELGDLDKEDQEELFEKLNKELDKEETASWVIDDEETIEFIKEKLDVEEENKEEEETEKSMTPKATETLKTVLDKLSKVQNEIPENYSFLYDSIAELVDESTPDFAKMKEAELDLSDEAVDAVKESLDELDKEELTNTEETIKKALEGLVVEKEDEKSIEDVDKEVKEKILKQQQEIEKLKEENQELKEKELRKELEEEASEFENIPTSKEDLTELFAELYKADEDVYSRVKNLLSKIDKESEVEELFKEKGTSARDLDKEEPGSAEERLDQLVKEIVEEEDVSEAKAMTKALEDNKELYEELKNERD